MDDYLGVPRFFRKPPDETRETRTQKKQYRKQTSNALESVLCIEKDAPKKHFLENRIKNDVFAHQRLLQVEAQGDSKHENSSRQKIRQE